MPRLTTTDRDATVDALMRAAHALNGSADDYDPLLELIGDPASVCTARPLTAPTSSTASAR